MLLPVGQIMIAIILLLGSTQLFMLGIIGKYLGRLYMESKKRPLFVIDTVYAQNVRRLPFPADGARQSVGRVKAPVRTVPSTGTSPFGMVGDFMRVINFGTIAA